MCPLSNQFFEMPLNDDTSASIGNWVAVSVSESKVLVVVSVSKMARKESVVW